MPEVPPYTLRSLHVPAHLDADVQESVVPYDRRTASQGAPKSDTTDLLPQHLPLYSTPPPGATLRLSEELWLLRRGGMRDASGNLPSAGTKEYKDLQGEIVGA